MYQTHHDPTPPPTRGAFDDAPASWPGQESPKGRPTRRQIREARRRKARTRDACFGQHLDPEGNVTAKGGAL